MKKKIWAAALICIVVLGMLDGCGPKEKDTDKEAAGNTETEAVEGLHATETETEAQGNLRKIPGMFYPVCISTKWKPKRIPL